MPLSTSTTVDTPRLAEISSKAISSRRPWVIALVTIIAVSTLVAAIGVLAAGVVAVRTVEMTDSLASQSILQLAFAGSLVQVSLLSFMFVWEKYRHGETTSAAGEATAER
jgi:hypothetical protein